jgi:regulatory protein
MDSKAMSSEMIASETAEAIEREAVGFQAEVERTAAAYRVALDSAMRSLSQREHSFHELERKLLRKGHDSEIVGRVFDYLAQHDLQSDARFVEVYIRSRINRGYGPVKIRQELSQRGISEIDLEGQLTESGEFWIDVAEAVVSKKYGRSPENRGEWNTYARFLARRGFPSDLIYRVLGTVQG